MVGVLSMYGEVEVTGLRLQLNLAGRVLFCGEESVLAVFAAFAKRERVIFWGRCPLSVCIHVSIQLLIYLWKYSVL